MIDSWINLESLPCAILIAAAALLLFLKLQERTARIGWIILLVIGMAHAIGMALLPENLMSRNMVHYFLGAKYDFPYSKFYSLTSAAIDRPQIFMHDLDHPPGFFRDDPTEQRAYFIDLLRAEKIQFDPMVPLEDLQELAQESGAVHREAVRILRENLPANEISDFCSDVKAALITENVQRDIEGIGSDITLDFGYNGSPFYTIVRHIDPTLYFPFGRATALLNLVWQVLAVFVSIWLIGTALGMTTTSRIAVAALLFASWDYVAWDLPGLSFAGYWLPIAIAIWAVSRNRALIGGAAIAWAGLFKLFPFALFIPAVIETVRAGWRRFRSEISEPSLWLNVGLLIGGVAATVVFAVAGVLSGRSWLDFLGKIVVQFSSDAYVANNVSVGQLLLVFGIYRSWITTMVSLIALLFLICLLWRTDAVEFRGRILLLVLAAMPWFTYLWFNYYTIAPIVLIVLVADRYPRGAAFSAVSLAIVYALPPFDGPILINNHLLWFLKVIPYLAIPAWLVFVEFRPQFNTRVVCRVGLIVASILIVIVGGEAVRQSMIRQYDSEGGRYLDQGQGQAALGSYNSLLGIAPQNAMAHMSKGICLAGMRQYDEAEASFRRATELSPDQPHTFLNLAHLLLMRGKLADAQAAIEKAAALAPYDDAIWVEQARITGALGDHNRAREMVIRALELNPQNREAKGLMRAGA